MFSASLAYGQMPVGMTPARVTNGTVANGQVQTGPVSYTPTVVSPPKATAEQGMQNNGLDAAKRQSDGGDAAAAALAAMAAVMAATCPACGQRGTCPICVAAAAGAAASGQTGSEMDRAQSLSNRQVKDVNPIGPKPKENSFANSPLYSSAKKDIEKATAGSSVKIADDFKSFTTPDGRTISTASLANGGAGSGLTPTELSSFKDMLKQAQTAAAKALKGNSEQRGAAETEDYPSGGSSFKAKVSPPQVPRIPVARAGRDPASVRGAFKDLNGDRIGVAMDSMFEMMHRRYKANSERDYFILEEK